MKFLLAFMFGLSLMSCGREPKHDNESMAQKACCCAEKCKCEKCDGGKCDTGCCSGDSNCGTGSCDSSGCCGDSCSAEPAKMNETAAQTISAFELPQMNNGGAMFRSVDNQGVYLFESYFLGCPYCNENAPNVNEMAASYSDNRIVHFIDLGIDRSNGQYDTWIANHNPNHPVLKDASRVVTNELGTTGYPSAYVVGCDMKVLYKTTGVWGSAEKAEIKAAIDNALQQDCGVIPVNN